MDRNMMIEQAVASFRALLLDQLDRVERMENDACGNKNEKNCLTIGIIDGDGIGPIIVGQAERVAEKLLSKEIAEGSVKLKRIEGLTIENRLATGKTLPDGVLDAIKECDVLLKGPTTTPKGGSMESANVALRRELDLFANVRPVCIPEKGIDWTFFRENTEGEYVLGSKGVQLGDKMAVDFKVTTVLGTERIARAGFEFARRNGKKNVAIVTKANIMKKTDGNFSAICHEVAKDYPEITAEDWDVDIMAANLINDSMASRFEVFVLPNLYGDILTDEAAQIQGGVGTAGSANTGSRYGMFEAIHGSAPRMVEQGIAEYANPASILRALVMLLDHAGLTDKANALAEAIDKTDANSLVKVTGDRDGATCRQYTDALLENL